MEDAKNLLVRSLENLFIYSFKGWWMDINFVGQVYTLIYGCAKAHSYNKKNVLQYPRK